MPRDVLSIDMIMVLGILFKLLWSSCFLYLFNYSRIFLRAYYVSREDVQIPSWSLLNYLGTQLLVK